MRSEPRKRSFAGRAALVVSFVFHLLLLIGLASLQLMEHVKKETSFEAALMEPKKRRAEPLIRRMPARKEAERPIPRELANSLSGPAMKTPAFTTPSSPRPMTIATSAPQDTNAAEFQLSALSANVEKTPSGTRIAASGAAMKGRGTGAGTRPGSGTGSGLGLLLHSSGSSGDENGIEAPKSPLRKIAEEMVKEDEDGGPVDVVFLLDISRSMQDNIYAVARRLEEMASVLKKGSLDFQIGIATFHTLPYNESIKYMDLTKDVEKVRKELRKVQCSGGEKSLNAIMKSIYEVKFRKGSARRFVFVTDEAVSGDHKSSAVLGALYRARITVDVIGVDEPFQRKMAAQTGGIWIDIKHLL